jgi:hypothetical protein
LWDLEHRLVFTADESVASGRFALVIEGEKERRTGAEAGRALLKIIPGLWWLRPLRHVLGLRALCGRIALAILRQRA